MASGFRVLANLTLRRRRILRRPRANRRQGRAAHGDLGHESSTRRPHFRQDAKDEGRLEARLPVHGPRAGAGPREDAHRLRLHRLLHERPHRGPPRGGQSGRERRARRPRPRKRPSHRRPRLRPRQIASGERGPRRHLHQRRLPVAGTRLLDVLGHEPRQALAPAALRVDLQSQLRGTPGQRRTDPPRLTPNRRRLRLGRRPRRRQTIPPRSSPRGGERGGAKR
mmetsp:Transcript_21022/g.67742  ORF Transcript_21022/g.67742 Transcript_21022/m.67742 type:complete len:224 (+) Transcript_21022:884-1555(+)